MKFKLACPNGQWVKGRPGSTEWFARLSGIGFRFEEVSRHNVVFLKPEGSVEVELNSLDELIELQAICKVPLRLVEDQTLVLDFG